MEIHQFVQQLSEGPGSGVIFTRSGHRRLRDCGLDKVLNQVADESGITIDPTTCLEKRPPLNDFSGKEFPSILSAIWDSNEAELILVVGLQTRWFQGHFPGHPVLAGVVQLDWGIRIGRRLFCIDKVFCGLRNVKFQNIVEPGSQLILNLSVDESKERLSFTYSSAMGIHSRGQALFS